MATIVSASIAKDNIKFRYGEPYTSNAANIQAGVNEPGAYRGGHVVAETLPQKSFRIAKGANDMVVVHRRSDTGHATVVRLASDVFFDMTSQWASVVGKSLYVSMAIEFQLNNETTGNFVVDDTPPTGDEVMLGVIDIPVGATEILQSYIREDGSARAKPIPRRFVQVRRRIDVPAAPARGSFQIPGKVCFMGDATAPEEKVQLFKASPDGALPLVYTDGSWNTPIGWFASESGGTMLTEADMDDDGCYTDPWISILFTTSQAFSAVYYEAVPLDEVEVVDQDVGFHGTHGDVVQCSTLAGSPDGVNGGKLPTMLASMLGLINGRIRAFDPRTPGAGWTLLWRSNNKVLDVAVDASTLSLYWSSSGMALVRGAAYLDSGTMDVVHCLGGGTYVSIQFSGVFSGTHRWGWMRGNPSAASNLLFTSPVGWKDYSVDSPTASSETREGNHARTLSGAKYSVTNSYVPTQREELFRLSGIGIAAYMQANRLFLTRGALWNSSTSTWEAFPGASTAIAIEFGSAGDSGYNFTLSKKTDVASPWASWDVMDGMLSSRTLSSPSFNPDGTAYSGGAIKTDIDEYIHGDNRADSYLISGGRDGYTDDGVTWSVADIPVAINFRKRYLVAPAILGYSVKWSTFSLADVSMVDTGLTVTTTGIYGSIRLNKTLPADHEPVRAVVEIFVG